MFEWDPSKARRNQVKHGVSFEETLSAFFDPKGLDGPDWAHSISEPRFVRVGKSATGSVLTVAYTIRRNVHDETKIRIISARKASRKERKAYSRLQD